MPAVVWDQLIDSTIFSAPGVDECENGLVLRRCKDFERPGDERENPGMPVINAGNNLLSTYWFDYRQTFDSRAEIQTCQFSSFCPFGLNSTLASIAGNSRPMCTSGNRFEGRSWQPLPLGRGRTTDGKNKVPLGQRRKYCSPQLKLCLI